MLVTESDVCPKWIGLQNKDKVYIFKFIFSMKEEMDNQDFKILRFDVQELALMGMFDLLGTGRSQSWKQPGLERQICMSREMDTKKTQKL